MTVNSVKFLGGICLLVFFFSFQSISIEDRSFVIEPELVYAAGGTCGGGGNPFTPTPTPSTPTPTPTPPTCSLEDVQKCLDGSNKCFDGTKWTPMVNDCDDHAEDQAECLKDAGYDPQYWVVCGGPNGGGHAFITVPTEEGDCVVDYGKCFPPNEDLLDFMNCKYGKNWEKLQEWDGHDDSDDPDNCSKKHKSFGSCTDCCIKKYNDAPKGNCNQYEESNEKWYWECRSHCPKPGYDNSGAG